MTTEHEIYTILTCGRETTSAKGTIHSATNSELREMLNFSLDPYNHNVPCPVGRGRKAHAFRAMRSRVELGASEPDHRAPAKRKSRNEQVHLDSGKIPRHQLLHW